MADEVKLSEIAQLRFDHNSARLREIIQHEQMLRSRIARAEEAIVNEETLLRSSLRLRIATIGGDRCTKPHALELAQCHEELRVLLMRKEMELQQARQDFGRVQAMKELGL